MNARSQYPLLSLFVLGVLVGCHKQGPVELLDSGLGSQRLTVDTSPITFEPFDPLRPDSLGFYLAYTKTYFGRMTLCASVLDAPGQHHTASLARAVFFDRSQPVVSNGVVVGYRTFDAGGVDIDTLPLQSVVTRVTGPALEFDTIGIQYNLLNKDSAGNGGYTDAKSFYVEGGREYVWHIRGSGAFLPDSVNVDLPPILRVTAPTAQDVIPVHENLAVRWVGGGSTVDILVSRIRSDGEPTAVLLLSVPMNRGGAVVPAVLLEALPPDESYFLFTFSSERSSVVRLDGYPDDVLLREVTSHSLYMKISR